MKNLDFDKGNLVKKYMIGNTEIEIYDGAFRNNTKEDDERILRRIEEIGRNALLRQMRKEVKEWAFGEIPGMLHI